jgi:hypothetical protein
MARPVSQRDPARAGMDACEENDINGTSNKDLPWIARGLIDATVNGDIDAIVSGAIRATSSALHGLEGISPRRNAFLSMWRRERVERNRRTSPPTTRRDRSSRRSMRAPSASPAS